MEGSGCQLDCMHHSGAHQNDLLDMLVQVHIISSCTCRHVGGYGTCALDIDWPEDFKLAEEIWRIRRG